MSLVSTRENLHKMQPLLIGFFIIFAAGIFFQMNPWGNANRGGNGGPTSTLAKINGQEVPRAAFDQRVRQYQSFMGRGQAVPMEQQASLYNYAWDSVLGEYAQSAAAQANGVSVTDSEAQAEVDRMIDEQVERLEAGSTAEQKANTRALLEQNVDLESQKRGMLAQRLREKLTKDARPVEVKVAHVLIKTDTRTPAQAERLIQDIARQAKGGADFAALANKFSDDTASKIKGGEAGWASAAPPAQTDPKAKKDPNAPTSFVGEFTAAALRLKKGEVSDPVLSTFGWHVLKALDERPYKPAPVKGAKPDPKKDQQALDDYKKQVGDKIAQGLFEEYKNRAKVEAVSPWLQGYLAEENANKNMMTIGKGGKVPTPAERFQPAITAYAAALKEGGVESGPPLAYKLAKLQQDAGQSQQALDTLNMYQGRDPDIEMLRGDVLEKLSKKTEALAAYQAAGSLAFSNPGIHSQLIEKYKKLGRNDLAEKAKAEQAKQLAQQAAQQKAQQEAQAKQFAEMQKQQAEAAAKEKAAKEKAAKEGAAKEGAANPGNAPAANGPVSATTTVTTPAANAPASNAPAANAPAANKPAAP